MGVIGVDPVRIEVLQFGHAAKIGERRDVVEQILVGHHVGGFFKANGEVGVGLEIATVEFRAELDAFDGSLRVVEGAEHQRLAEIAVVDEIGRDLIICVDAEIEISAILGCRLAAAEWNILIDSSVEIMRPLGQHRTRAAGSTAPRLCR